jgi:hypothetical protein
MRGISSFPSLVLVGYASFGLSLVVPFVFHVMVLAIFLIIMEVLRIGLEIKLNLLSTIISHIQILGMIKTTWNSYVPFVHCEN